MQNTHFVDDEVAPRRVRPDARVDTERGWPLEALATAPVVPFSLRADAQPDRPRRRVARSVVPGLEDRRLPQVRTEQRVDVRDEWAY